MQTTWRRTDGAPEPAGRPCSRWRRPPLRMAPHREERGSVLPLMAVAIVVLGGAVLLVGRLGVAATDRAGARAAADAAALAGAAEGEGPARELAAVNGADGEELRGRGHRRPGGGGAGDGAGGGPGSPVARRDRRARPGCSRRRAAGPRHAGRARPGGAVAPRRLPRHRRLSARIGRRRAGRGCRPVGRGSTVGGLVPAGSRRPADAVRGVSGGRRRAVTCDDGPIRVTFF